MMATWSTVMPMSVMWMVRYGSKENAEEENRNIVNLIGSRDRFMVKRLFIFSFQWIISDFWMVNILCHELTVIQVWGQIAYWPQSSNGHNSLQVRVRRNLNKNMWNCTGLKQNTTDIRKNPLTLCNLVCILCSHGSVEKKNSLVK